MQQILLRNQRQYVVVWRRVRGVFFLLLICAGIIVALVPDRVARAAQACTNGQQIAIGKYSLFNNLWGANSGTGQQCIWEVGQTDSSVSWATHWNWSGQFQVKSYASVLLGWHWQKPPASSLTGLPLQLLSNQPVQTKWAYQINQQGPGTTFNIAYDLWLHTIPTPILENPSDEVMLWLYRQGTIHPVGSPGVHVTLDGASWTLWTGTGSSGWHVHTFVRDENTTAAQSLNLNDFLQYLVSKQGLSHAKYLTGIEAGSEVWLGTAELDTSSYSTDVGTVVGVSPLATPSPFPTPSPTAGFSPTPSSPSPTPPTPPVERTPTAAPTRDATSTQIGTPGPGAASPGSAWLLPILLLVAVLGAVGACVFLVIRLRLSKARDDPFNRTRER